MIDDAKLTAALEALNVVQQELAATLAAARTPETRRWVDGTA